MNHPTAIVLIAAALVHTAASAEPVRVAVAGVTGEASPGDLERLSSELRGELARQLDPAIFAVVTREEMGRVYAARGGACRPTDAPCLVAASAAWSGRLFVSARVAKTSDAVALTASIDSVRGLHVADARVESVADVHGAVPDLAAQLIDGERAFRAKAFVAPAAPAAVIDAGLERRRAPAPVVDDAATPAAAAPKSEPFVCHGSPNGLPASGDLVIDDDGVSFQTTDGFAKTWARRWSEIRTADTYLVWFHPAFYLVPDNAWESFGIRFADSSERDRCFNEIIRRWHAPH